jgi:sulfatase modifying factor 1
MSIRNLVCACLLFMAAPVFAQSSPDALFKAAEQGKVADIRKALAQGVSVNVADPAGWTPLLVAAGEGQLAAVQALVKAGANVNGASKKGETALMAAVLSGNIAVVKYLLAEGADKTAATAKGLTAADIAVQAKKPEIAKLLAPAGNAAATAKAASPKQIEAKEAAAVEAYQKKRFDDAARLFKELVDLNPRSAEAWHFLGQSLAKSGDVDGARKAYERFLEIEPRGDLADHTRRLMAEPFRDCADCPEMVAIPAGGFGMGSPASEAGREEREGPLHRVTLGRPFALAKYEVTVGEFRAFVQATNYRTDAENNVGNAEGCFILDTVPGGKNGYRSGHYWDNPGFNQGARHPVVCVSWNDAKAYVKWLAEKTGKGYRLPSEAEWEYAARAGTTTARYWGDDPNQACGYANVADQSKGPGAYANGFGSKHECNDGNFFAAPVGSYRANAFGLHDMLGNAWEWTEDCANPGYADAPSDGSAWTTGDCAKRVARGGGWGSRPGYVRAAYRSGSGATVRIDNFGFRPARMLP